MPGWAPLQHFSLFSGEAWLASTHTHTWQKAQGIQHNLPGRRLSGMQAGEWEEEAWLACLSSLPQLPPLESGPC